MDIEKDKIIKEIKNTENIKTYTENLIDEYIQLYPSRKIFLESVKQLSIYNDDEKDSKFDLDYNDLIKDSKDSKDSEDSEDSRDSKDSELTKRLLFICSNYEIDDFIYLKLINALMERQNHHNILFVERAALISTALFKVDDFNARNISCFQKYKKYLNFNFPENKIHCKIENYKLVDNIKKINKNINENIKYKYKFNHSFTIQDFLIALKKKEDWDEIENFIDRLEPILNRTSTITFERYCDDIFDQLLKIQNFDFVDYQVKGLSSIISRNEKYFDILNTLFFETKLETLKFLIISTFCNVDEMEFVNKNVKYQMHLKFTEKFISQKYDDFSSIIWKTIKIYLQNGMRQVRMS